MSLSSLPLSINNNVCDKFKRRLPLVAQIANSFADFL